MARNLIVAGQGIRLAGQVEIFRELAERDYVVTTWLGADLLPSDHPNNLGIIGPCGNEGANQALHAADNILLWGTSWGVGHVGSVPPKGRLVERFHSPSDKGWARRIDPQMVGSYALNAEMTRMLPAGTCMVVDGGGTALYTGFQSSFIKEGSRLLCSAAISAMGSGLPEAIGACLANGRRLTTCLIGDGSLMFNIQELQTIRTLDLPIKIFVINNGGYLAIRKTQKDFQEGRYYGVGYPDLAFPDFCRVAEAFGLEWTEFTEHALSHPAPTICEWECQRDQPTLHQKFIDGKPQPLSDMEFS